MRTFLLPALLLLTAAAPSPELARLRSEASHVTITRDDWGIAHVHGHTDADAVFGMIYAQAEDDFPRIEANYLTSLGRTAEADGEKAIWQDLRARLYVSDSELKADYARSPPAMRKLMDAWADGLNYFLATHPNVRPRVITHFEPWMVMSFTEGSIGGDIERIDLDALRDFYSSNRHAELVSAAIAETGAWPAKWTLKQVQGDKEKELEPQGSNGIAIAPRLTTDGRSLLLINPHTTFFFRSELQMSSDEGLDAYGASTWGQFFIYQGFNPHIGWMHTSSGVDNVDEFLETVVDSGGRKYYRHGASLEPMLTRVITIPFRTDSGMARKTVTAYFTRHGPVVREAGDKWVSVSLMNSPVSALIQSYTRTKARDYAAFRKIMDLHTNSSNNTIFADAEGNIAYFHSNYIPRRDTSFDWTAPVDGSDPRTDYHGVLSFDETPNLLNPASGWLYNSNNWPWSAAGPSSPRREDFPRYVETGTEETARGYHALRVLSGTRDFAMSSLTAAAFDSYLPAFAAMIPPLLQAYDGAPPSDSLPAKLGDQIAALRGWDLRWGATSVP